LGTHRLLPGLFRASNGKNGFDPAKDNPFAIGKIVIGSVGAVVAAAGIVLLPFSGGSSAFITAAGISLVVSGAVVTATDIAFTIGDTLVNPVTLSNMYGPDGDSLG